MCQADRSGGDFGNAFTGSLEGCSNSCAQKRDCVSAQYNHLNGYCYYKDRRNTLTGNSDVDTVDCDR